MKKEKLILIRETLIAYFLYTIMFFGLSVLFKHFVFSEEMNRDKILETLITSLFVALLFVIVFRGRITERFRNINASSSSGDQ